MKYPVNYIAITQGFHQGLCIDLGWNSKYGGKNQPIYAVADGTVYKVEVQNKGGNVIYIEHDDSTVSCYAHLDNKDILVKKNDRVKEGQQIALMGTTGSSSTGNHLHFGLFTSTKVIYKDSTINPFDNLLIEDNQVVSNKTKENYPIKYKPKETYKYVSNVDYEGLNVRSNPSLNSPVLEILPVSTKVKVLSQSNNFTKIDNNKWVYSKYLSTNIPKYKEVVELKDPPLNIRKGPSTKYQVIATLPSKAKVQVYKTYNNWSKISPSVNAWVSSNYLK